MTKQELVRKKALESDGVVKIVRLLPDKCNSCAWLQQEHTCSWLNNGRNPEKCINSVTKQQLLDRLDNTMFWYYLWRLK